MWRPCTWARCTTERSSRIDVAEHGERTTRPQSQPWPTNADIWTPYARVGEDGVSYAGPQRPDVPQRARCGWCLFGPQADAVARSAEHEGTVGWWCCQGADRGRLVPVASDQNWGAASTQLVHALWDEHALAIVALDRDAATWPEQLALKAFVPVVALSDDKSLTSTNVPWIFRLPAGTSRVHCASFERQLRSAAAPIRRRCGMYWLLGPIAVRAFAPTGEPRGTSRGRGPLIKFKDRIERERRRAAIVGCPFVKMPQCEVYGR